MCLLQSSGQMTSLSATVGAIRVGCVVFFPLHTQMCSRDHTPHLPHAAPGQQRNPPAKAGLKSGPPPGPAAHTHLKHTGECWRLDELWPWACAGQRTRVSYSQPLVLYICVKSMYCI